MDKWNSFRSRDSGSEPVYSTPNPPPLSLSPSSLPSSTRSPSLSTTPAKSVSFAEPLPSNAMVIAPSSSFNNILDNLDPNHLANLLAVIGKALPSDPSVIAQRLNDLQKQENELEDRLSEIESKKKDIRDQRSQLIKQLEKVLSSQSIISSNTVKSSTQLSPLVKSAETTIIEPLDPDPPSQPRSPISIKKKIGPASKTGIKAINPGSLPPLGLVPGTSKKSQKGGDDALKRPITTGVKQSRPQPMRARKRNKDNETESPSVPSSSISVEEPTVNEPKSKSPTQEKSQPSPPIPQSPSQVPSQQQKPQPRPSQSPKPSQTPSSKPGTPHSTQSSGTPITKESIKVEQKTEEKPRNLKKDLPSSFRERSDTGSSSNNEPIKKKIKQEPGTKKPEPKVSRDDDADPLRSNPVRSNSDDDSAHSDSDIFNILRNVQANGESPDISIRKVKKEPETNGTPKAPGTPLSVKVEHKDTPEREPKIKQEK